MLNQIQGALMTEAKRMEGMVGPLGARLRLLAHAYDGMPEGVHYKNRADEHAQVEEKITEHAYACSVMHNLLDARACTQDALRLPPLVYLIHHISTSCPSDTKWRSELNASMHFNFQSNLIACNCNYK